MLIKLIVVFFLVTPCYLFAAITPDAFTCASPSTLTVNSFNHKFYIAVQGITQADAAQVNNIAFVDAAGAIVNQIHLDWDYINDVKNKGEDSPVFLNEDSKANYKIIKDNLTTCSAKIPQGLTTMGGVMYPVFVDEGLPAGTYQLSIAGMKMPNAFVTVKGAEDGTKSANVEGSTPPPGVPKTELTGATRLRLQGDGCGLAITSLGGMTSKVGAKFFAITAILSALFFSMLHFKKRK